MDNGESEKKMAMEAQRLLATNAHPQAASARILAQRLSLSRETVTQVLTRLEVAGLIHAAHLDGTDDPYSLSPAGEAWLAREDATAFPQGA
jgi:DNA-binding IscR family transcriptional regulator